MLCLQFLHDYMYPWKVLNLHRDALSPLQVREQYISLQGDPIVITDNT
jgi:hypothetical protein